MIDDSWQQTPEGWRAREAAAERFMLCLKVLGQDMPEEAARCVARMRWSEEARFAAVPPEVIEQTEDVFGRALDTLEKGGPDAVRDLLFEIMELWY